MFFSPIKLDGVVCISLCGFFGEWGMGRPYFSKCHTRYRPTLIGLYIISDNTLVKISNIEQFINLNV
jgi:hypothetical protein